MDLLVDCLNQLENVGQGLVVIYILLGGNNYSDMVLFYLVFINILKRC